MTRRRDRSTSARRTAARPSSPTAPAAPTMRPRPRGRAATHVSVEGSRVLGEPAPGTPRPGAPAGSRRWRTRTVSQTSPMASPSSGRGATDHEVVDPRRRHGQRGRSAAAASSRIHVAAIVQGQLGRPAPLVPFGAEDLRQDGRLAGSGRDDEHAAGHRDDAGCIVTRSTSGSMWVGAGMASAQRSSAHRRRPIPGRRTGRVRRHRRRARTRSRTGSRLETSSAGRPQVVGQGVGGPCGVAIGLDRLGHADRVDVRRRRAGRRCAAGRRTA